MINTDTYRTREWWPMALALPVLLLAGLLSACDVNGPADERWLDVSSFSWPIDTQAVMRYVTTATNSVKTDTVSVRLTDSMEKKKAALRNELTAINRWNLPDQIYTFDIANASDRYFLPLKDTLITLSSDMGVTYALVAPLEKDHTWPCSYDDNNNPTKRAKIIERYSYRKVAGKVYKNVIEVEYRPTVGDTTSFWVCFYAQGIGPIQILKNHTPISSGNTSDTAPTTEVDEETVLIETNVQQK
ncbi:MAG: hypothetical protein ABIR47_00960 [Candidatus Kapaibacterium sp.]